MRGGWVEDHVLVKEAIKAHFQYREGFILEMPSSLALSRLEGLEGDYLVKPFLKEEIRAAVWECEGSKSPGPDGFNFEFFRSCWDIVMGDLVRMMCEFHTNGKLIRGCNSSFIVLIPKKEGSCRINDMHPISLVGSIYKILAKVLAI